MEFFTGAVVAAQAGGLDARLTLPDLSAFTFLGIDGKTLLLLGSSSAATALAWLADNWVNVVALLAAILFLYAFTALMLDLPMPFESKKRPADEPVGPADGTPPL